MFKKKNKEKEDDKKKDNKKKPDHVKPSTGFMKKFGLMK